MILKEKVLKLTGSVYRALEFFPELDPLKNRAKDKALAIMDSFILIDGSNSLTIFQQENIKTRLLEDIDILLRYLWIAKSQSWLSSVNYMIINNEYENIKKDIQSREDLIYDTPVFKEEVLPPVQEIIEEEPVPVLEIEKIEKEADKEDIKNILEKKPEKKPEVTVGLSSRQDKILSFLNKNDKVQVMDLQTVLPDVTKRTIRRDLDNLLKINKIIRMGEFNQVFYKIKEGKIIYDRTSGR